MLGVDRSFESSNILRVVLFSDWVWLDEFEYIMLVTLVLSFLLELVLIIFCCYGVEMEPNLSLLGAAGGYHG